jgi:hypothetical protein
MLKCNASKRGIAMRFAAVKELKQKTMDLLKESEDV